MMREIAFLVALSFSLSVAAAAPKIRVEPIASKLERPVYVTHDGTERLFIVEQPGCVRLVVHGQLLKKPYLDVTKRVRDQGECGFLSIAFHPDFAKNGYFYTNYTAPNPKLHTVISEFHAEPSATEVDPSTERILLTIDQPFPNHNGGQIQFGPDGMLYIGMGDGGSANDPHRNGQDAKSLLGKILRIDVNNRSPYGIPKDNPLVGKSGRGEIWAGGMRNPWRFSFDRETGDCFAGDVGQNQWEEVDVIVKGGNYGWRAREGFHPNPNLRPREDVQGPVADPILEYPHADKNISITGGYVYRGKAIPDLVGWYLYADYSSGRIWALRYENGKANDNTEIFKDNMPISSFGEDANGELYICDHGNGRVFKIVAK